MATIDKDGVYRVGDKVTGSQFKFLKGHDIGDLEVTRVGDLPEREDADDVKATSAPANKQNAAPENKSA